MHLKKQAQGDCGQGAGDQDQQRQKWYCLSQKVTKKNRSLEFKSIFRESRPGRRKISVKVVDIFGNDTMKIVEVTIGGQK